MSKKSRLYLILFSATFLVVLFVFIWAFVATSSVRNVSKETAAGQNVSVKNLVLTETKDDKIYWELYAQKGEYESDTSKVILTEPTGNFYNTENQVVMSFQSDYGYYFGDTKIIVLKGNTLIVAHEGSSISADELTIKGKDEDIVASGNVVYKKNDDLVTNSKKARFNSDLTFFEISGDTQTKLYSKSTAKTQGLIK